MCISNSAHIILENSWQRVVLVEPKVISSIYIWAIKISFFNDFLNSVVSTWPLEKPFSKRKLASLSYQALGAYFRPYIQVLSLKAYSRCFKYSNPEGCITYTST